MQTMSRTPTPAARSSSAANRAERPPQACPTNTTRPPRPLQTAGEPWPPRPPLAAAAQVLGPDAVAAQPVAHRADPPAEHDGLSAEEEDAPRRTARVGVGDAGGRPAEADEERHEAR